MSRTPADHSDVVESNVVRIWPGGHIFRLDLRSLAAFRILFSLTFLVDTVIRITDLKAHYTDFGVLPRAQLLELGWNYHWFSLHMTAGSELWIGFFFFLQLLASVALLVGWRTRFTTLFCWLLLISVHARNPMVLNGGDIYLRVMLFWMLFLPWGHRWSWDALFGKGDIRVWMPAVKNNQVVGLAGLGVALQIASVYWFAALPKTDPSWTVNYTATELALRIDQFVTPFGYWFREAFSAQLGFLTRAIVSWESYAPFLLLFPLDRGQTRTFAITGFVAMHIGFGSMMELGLFAYIGVVMLVLLLPAWFWDGPMGRMTKFFDDRLGQDQRQSQSQKRGWRFLMEAFSLFLIIYCFAWNLGNEGLRPNLRVPKSLLWFGHTFRLDQRWNMFSPGPFTEDGWYVVEGKFRHGVVADLFNGGRELSWDKPKDVAHTYRNQRWRKYMMNLWLAENRRHRSPYGQYISRLWNPNGRSEKELSGFNLVYMLENTLPDGREAAPVKKVLWKHWCFESRNELVESSP